MGMKTFQKSDIPFLNGFFIHVVPVKISYSDCNNPIYRSRDSDIDVFVFTQPIVTPTCRKLGREIIIITLDISGAKKTRHANTGCSASDLFLNERRGVQSTHTQYCVSACVFWTNSVNVTKFKLAANVIVSK